MWNLHLDVPARSCYRCGNGRCEVSYRRLVHGPLRVLAEMKVSIPPGVDGDGEGEDGEDIHEDACLRLRRNGQEIRWT